MTMPKPSSESAESFRHWRYKLPPGKEKKKGLSSITEEAPAEADEKNAKSAEAGIFTAGRSAPSNTPDGKACFLYGSAGCKAMEKRLCEALGAEKDRFLDGTE